MKLIPLGDKVVLKQMVAEETTKSGIVLTGSAKEKPQQAEVIAVGPGTDEVQMQVKVGDKVICTKYAGTEVKLDGVEYMVVRQNDILVIVEE
ncbi:MAG: co-chaperone GroES [Lachnospiraceae bacterium]|nr:co-chaperone GroES [Lachnospiraceae bacterium]